MKNPFRRPPAVDTHDEIYAKARNRLQRMSAQDIENYVEIHLSGAYMAFDDYRKQPHPIARDEVRKNLAIVRAAMDILDERDAADQLGALGQELGT